MINLKIRINVDEQVLALPVDTQFVPGIPEKDPVVMVTEITEPEELKYLERDEWNIEELNFLAKRMESFDKREQSQFDAAVSIFRPKTVEALINYTYNLPRFTLISDFSTPNAIGVSHILNRKQVMSLDEMASTDFAKIGKELMQSGKGITTPYGVLFVNEDIPFEPVYDGRHFPAFDYKGSCMTVEVSGKGEKEYLYLPCDTADIDHALAKLPAKTWEECECSLESSNFPAEDWSENSKSILANEGVYCLNNTCEALRRLYEDLPNHNAVFVGTDENGKPRHIQKRSTNPQSDYKGNVLGSDISYAFHYVGTSDKLFVFEAPIDMLAYISMNKRGWKQHSYTALCSTADCAAIRMLNTYPNLKEVYLCLDHDSAGIEGAYRIAESIHNLGEYSVWRKMPKNKDWDEDLKQYHGKDALPCSEHKKMHMFLQKCSEYLTRNCQETKLWKHIADSRGYAVDNTLALLHSEIDKAENALDIAGTQEHLKNCVIGCIAFCYCKDEQMEYPALFSHWANTLQAMYKPHKDTGNSTEQWSMLKKNLAALEKNLSRVSPLTESEVNEQEKTVITFAFDCIRLCATMETEQTEQSLILNLE